MAFPFQKEKEGEVEFIDAENYIPQYQGAKTYESIVLNQIQVCVNEGSKEMIGGYMQETQTRQGVKEKYIDDQRQKWMESINRLYDLILPFFDEGMKNSNKKFDNNLSKLMTEIKDRLSKRIIGSNDMRIKSYVQFQIDTGYLDVNSFEAKYQIDEKLRIWRILFQDLIALYHRTKHLLKEELEIRD